MVVFEMKTDMKIRMRILRVFGAADLKRRHRLGCRNQGPLGSFDDTGAMRPEHVPEYPPPIQAI